MIVKIPFLQNTIWTNAAGYGTINSSDGGMGKQNNCKLLYRNQLKYNILRQKWKLSKRTVEVKEQVLTRAFEEGLWNKVQCEYQRYKLKLKVH